MQDFPRSARSKSHSRRFVAPLVAVVMASSAIALSTQAALAITVGRQAKPQMNVEAERGSQTANLFFKGKNWAPNSRIKIVGTRAPGANAPQDFGMYSADASGNVSAAKRVNCTSQREEDGAETVTVTASDSATGVKVSVKLLGGAWICS